jgi:cytochrome c-type biogenesis protein CcmH
VNIWLIVGMVLLALLGLAPLVFAAVRPGLVRYRRETAMALHRAQLQEIDRDRAEGRLAESEYEGAKLEVERRLLAADRLEEPPADRRAGALLIATAVLVPLGAVALFLPGVLPIVPSEPHAQLLRQVDVAAKRDDQLIAQLEAKLAVMNPNSEEAREGYLLLGQALAARENPAGAAKAWSMALQAKFDPTLAAETAEAETEAAGRVTPEAAKLFQEALAKGPKSAPWRKLAHQRLREAAVTLPNPSSSATSHP